MQTTNDVLDTAERIAATHPLRALDAIHVASARLFADRITGAELVFVSADKRQTDAATAIGLAAKLIS